MTQKVLNDISILYLVYGHMIPNFMYIMFILYESCVLCV